MFIVSSIFVLGRIKDSTCNLATSSILACAQSLPEWDHYKGPTDPRGGRCPADPQLALCGPREFQPTMEASCLGQLGSSSPGHLPNQVGVVVPMLVACYSCDQSSTSSWSLLSLLLLSGLVLCPQK